MTNHNAAIACEVYMTLDKNARKALLDVVWGDGYVKENGSVVVKHGPSQVPYLEWKADYLKSHGIKVSDMVTVESGGHTGYQIYVPVTPWGKTLRKGLYRGSFKNITNKAWLRSMDEQRLAMWFMDDGGVGYQRARGKIKCTQLGLYTSLTKENNQILSDFIRERWGVSFYICKAGNWTKLMCGTKQARVFVEIVRPYVEQVPCMAYKLVIKPDVKPNGKYTQAGGSAKQGCSLDDMV